MSDKLKIWNANNSWKESEAIWDQGAKESSENHPIKTLKRLPKMRGISKETEVNLKWKSFKYMLMHDDTGGVRRGFLRHPLRYLTRYLRSLLDKKSYKRDDDFFLYATDSVKDFQEELRQANSLLIVGFSYCHKPYECPSGRFSTDCIHDPQNSTCRQCFIGKTVNALPEEHCVPLFITTVHYISEKIFEYVHAYPGKNVLFLITACEMTLEMFGDWGKMTQIKGIGVRLDGRICNTMKAFELSEKGIKPGLTVVLDHTQKRMLDLIQFRHEQP